MAALAAGMGSEVNEDDLVQLAMGQIPGLEEADARILARSVIGLGGGLREFQAAVTTRGRFDLAEARATQQRETEQIRAQERRAVTDMRERGLDRRARAGAATTRLNALAQAAVRVASRK